MYQKHYGRHMNHGLYFSIFYKLLQSLTQLVIDYPNTDSINGNFTFNGISGDYLHFLPHFTQLTDLTICNTMKNSARDINGMDVIGAYILPFFAVLNVCHSLVNFNYECFIRVPMRELLIEMELATPMDHYNNNVTKLKKLHLTIPFLAKYYMEFLTKNVTNNLQEFVVVTNHGIKRNDWMETDDMASLMAFAESVQNIPQLSISPRYERLLDKEESHADGDFSTDTPSTRGSLEMVQLYWKFVNAVKGSRVLDCGVRFVVSQQGNILGPHAGSMLNIKNNCHMDLSYRFSNMDCLFPDNASSPQLDLFLDP